MQVFDSCISFKLSLSPVLAPLLSVTYACRRHQPHKPPSLPPASLPLSSQFSFSLEVDVLKFTPQFSLKTATLGTFNQCSLAQTQIFPYPKPWCRFFSERLRLKTPASDYLLNHLFEEMCYSLKGRGG